MPPLIILVRHAQSEHHVNGLTGGWTDTPLTELGRRQAERLAERLRLELEGLPVSIYTSDLLRAAQTARAVAKALGGNPIPDARLREFNNGETANKKATDVLEQYAHVFGRPWGIDEQPFPGSETNRQFSARCASFLGELPVEGSVPILVTHGGTIPRLIGEWLKLGADGMANVGFASHTASITTLVHDPSGLPAMERHNDIAHLAGLQGWQPLSAFA